MKFPIGFAFNDESKKVEMAPLVQQDTVQLAKRKAVLTRLNIFKHGCRIPLQKESSKSLVVILKAVLLLVAHLCFLHFRLLNWILIISNKKPFMIELFLQVKKSTKSTVILQ